MESQNTMIRHSLRESQDPGSPGVPYLNANDIGNLKKIGMKGDKGDHPKTSSMAASQDHKGSQLSRQMIDPGTLQDMQSNREKVGSHYNHVSNFVASQAEMPTGLGKLLKSKETDNKILSSLESKHKRQKSHGMDYPNMLNMMAKKKDGMNTGTSGDRSLANTTAH